jgi:hypothetical protein
MTALSRILLTLPLATLTAFCAFGFLASFEHPSPNAWQVAYAGVGGILCLTIWRIWRRR